MKRVVSAQARANYCVQLTFDTGESGTVDHSHLAGKGVFARWREEDSFRCVAVGPNGELSWGDEIGLCPDALYRQMTGMRPGELFPVLRRTIAGLHTSRTG